MSEYQEESNIELINQAIDRVEEVLHRLGWSAGYSKSLTIKALQDLQKTIIDNQLEDWGMGESW